MSDDISQGSMRLFHPRGVQVWLPLPFDGDYRKAFAAVGAALDAGFLVQAPGLEEGEEKEEIGYVCRIDHESERGVTPTVLLYSSTEQLTYSYLRKYLNTDDDIAEFEFACKVRLTDLPIYPGNDHPQRGKSQKTDRFIVALATPTTLIWKHNPRYRDAPPGDDNRKTIEKTKRLFVRWADTKPAIEPENGDAGIRANLDKYIAEKGLPAAADLVLKGLGKEGVKEADALRKFGLTDRKALTVEHVVTMRGDLTAISEGGARAGDLYPSEATRLERSKRLSSKGGGS